MKNMEVDLIIQQKVQRDLEKYKRRKPDMTSEEEKMLVSEFTRIQRELYEIRQKEEKSRKQKKTKKQSSNNKEKQIKLNDMDLERELSKLDFKFIKYVDTIYGHRNVVYCYLNRKTELIDYIGSTSDMQRRLHARNYDKRSNISFDVYYRNHQSDYELYLLRLCNTRDEAYEYEKKFIQIIKPKFNIQWNPNKHVIRDSRQQYYSSSEWQKLSSKKRQYNEETNNGLCQLCGKNKATEVHHLVKFYNQDSEELREQLLLDEDNIICLCSECHHKIHSKRGLLNVQQQKIIDQKREAINQKYFNMGQLLNMSDICFLNY